MKKILLVIDFSPATKQTMEFALKFAEKMKTNLMVLNVIDFMEKMVGLRSVNKIIQDDATERLDSFLAPYKKSTSVKILSKIAKGDAYTVISRQAEVNNVELIILGAEGEDSEERYFLGRVAGSVIKFTHLPVIAIPNNYIPRDITNIVFMYRNLHKSIFEVINPLLEVSSTYNAKIHSVHLTGKHSGSVAYSPELIFENYDFDHSELTNDSFTEGIKTLIKNAGEPDLICVLKRKRGMLEYIFESSPTSKEIIDSPVPVLFLNDDES
ncbi:MAG: universal stress protein [Saprospiraceae bacterium]